MSIILNEIRKAILAGVKSRYQLSQETGIDQAQLSRLMKGKSLGVENAEKLAAALGIKITVSIKRKGK